MFEFNNMFIHMRYVSDSYVHENSLIKYSTFILGIQTLTVKNKFEMKMAACMIIVVVVVVVVVVVGQTVGPISSKMLAYDCLYTLELCTASMIATS